MRMPPRRQIGEGEDASYEVKLSLSGIPVELYEKLQGIVNKKKRDGQKVKYGDIYAEAIRNVISLHGIMKGKVSWLSTDQSTASKRIQFWMPEKDAEDFLDFCDRISRTQSSVMVTALTHYLAKH